MRILNNILAAVCILAGMQVGAQDVYWTGAGDGASWSDTNNWNTLALPGAGDIVWLGHPAYTPDSPQAISVDMPGVRINGLRLAGTGSRAVTLGYSDTNNISTTNLDAVVMADTATADATVGVTVYMVGDWLRLRNDSTNATLIFSQPLASSGTGTDSIMGDGKIIFSERLADKSYNVYAPTVIINAGGVVARAWQPQSGHVQTLLTASPSFGRRLTPVVDFNVAVAGAGSNDQSMTFYYGISGVDGTWLTITNGPDGNAGRVSIRFRGVSSYAFARNGSSIMTREGDTVEAFGNAGTDYHIGYASTPRIAGAGNFLINNGTHNLESALTYSGRTMLASGILRLSSYTNVTVYDGSLPSATVLEIGSAGHFYLNGIDQTLGGLSGYNGTYGQIYLDGAALTINADGDTTFGGLINGTGTLVKCGAAAFSMLPGYTNVTDRVLRVEDGLLDVGGPMDVTQGELELAGGRIAAAALASTGATWNAILSHQNANVTMVEITGDADITGATLDLAVAAGYIPRHGDSFVLLHAGGTLTGAAAGGAIFQYTDGQLLEVDGERFRILLADNRIILKAVRKIMLMQMR